MKDETTKFMLTSLIANTFLTVIKIFFGMFTKSKTLLADGVHCLSDMSTDIIGIIGAKISNIKPDKDHPYGHGKAEYITSIFISVFIIFLAFKIFTNSFTPSYKIDTYYILIISIISIIVKFYVSRLLIKSGKRIKSSILLTSGSESRFDVLSSSLAFIFILLSLFSEKLTVLKYADTAGSIVISILTLRVGIKLFIENFKLSLGEIELDKKTNDEVRNLLSDFKEIKNIRRVTILKYGSYRMVNIDIEMKGNITVNKAYVIDQNIKRELKSIHPEYKYININIKPIEKSKS